MTYSMLQSRISRSEGQEAEFDAVILEQQNDGSVDRILVTGSGHPVIAFKELPDGTWYLVGYAWPVQGKMQNYALHSVPNGKKARQRQVAVNTTPPEQWQGEDFILLAANMRVR
jgi:hypothetical protein